MGNELIILVIMNVLDFMNASRQKNATADDAGIVCDVRGASKGRYPTLRAIGDCILFRMHGRLLMPVSYNRCVFASRKKSIVSLTYNTIRVNKDATYMKPLTWTSLRGHLHNFLKILVPRRSHSEKIRWIPLNCMSGVG